MQEGTCDGLMDKQPVLRLCYVPQLPDEMKEEVIGHNGRHFLHSCSHAKKHIFASLLSVFVVQLKLYPSLLKKCVQVVVSEGFLISPPARMHLCSPLWEHRRMKWLWYAWHIHLQRHEKGTFKGLKCEKSSVLVCSEENLNLRQNKTKSSSSDCDPAFFWFLY